MHEGHDGKSIPKVLLKDTPKHFIHKHNMQCRISKLLNQLVKLSIFRLGQMQKRLRIILFPFLLSLQPPPNPHYHLIAFSKLS